MDMSQETSSQKCSPHQQEHVGVSPPAYRTVSNSTEEVSSLVRGDSAYYSDEYSFMSELAHENETQRKEPLFSCRVCRKGFEHAVNLLSHMRKYKCSRSGVRPLNIEYPKDSQAEFPNTNTHISEGRREEHGQSAVACTQRSSTFQHQQAYAKSRAITKNSVVLDDINKPIIYRVGLEEKLSENKTPSLTPSHDCDVSDGAATDPTCSVMGCTVVADVFEGMRDHTTDANSQSNENSSDANDAYAANSPAVERTQSSALFIPGTSDESGDECASPTNSGQILKAASMPLEVDADRNIGECPDETLSTFSSNASPSNTCSEGGSESSSDRSVLDQSQKRMVLQLMDEICSSLLFQLCHQPRQHGRRSADPSTSDSSENPATCTQIDSKESVLGQGKRMRRDDGIREEEEEDGGNKRERSKNPTLNDTNVAEVRYFACPFHKFDASCYSNHNENPRFALKFRSCGPPGWSTIGKMKEHLYRSHQTPIHCPRCWTVMKTEAALGDHACAVHQCDVLPQPLRCIPREVYEKLKDRKKAFSGQTDEDTWRYIFGLIFPDRAIIPSPYYGDSTVVHDEVENNSPTARAIAAYEEYARAHLPRLVEEALEITVAEQTQPIEEDLRRALAGIVRDCHTKLAQSFLQHRSSTSDDTAAQIDALPLFYIEPLTLTNENSVQVRNQDTSHKQFASASQADSGYMSSSQPYQNSSLEPLGDQNCQDGFEFLYYVSDDWGCDIDPGHQAIPDDCDLDFTLP